MNGGNLWQHAVCTLAHSVLGVVSYIPALVLLHDLQQHKCADNVVVIVFQWDLHTLAHCLEACKVDGCIKLLLSKQLVKGLLVPDITLAGRKMTKRQQKNNLSR